MADAQKHELIRTLRLVNGKSLRETARLAGVSKMTVIRVCSNVEKIRVVTTPSMKYIIHQINCSLIMI
ncbi:hypothetical protein CEJ52_23575 [Escherichia coli]|nr:hypothetical protein CEJ52_23575 [Escherichia coli]